MAGADTDEETAKLLARELEESVRELRELQETKIVWPKSDCKGEVKPASSPLPWSRNSPDQLGTSYFPAMGPPPNSCKTDSMKPTDPPYPDWSS